MKLFICIGIDLAFDNLQRLIWHKTQINKQFVENIYIYIYIERERCLDFNGKEHISWVISLPGKTEVELFNR